MKVATVTWGNEQELTAPASSWGPRSWPGGGVLNVSGLLESDLREHLQRSGRRSGAGRKHIQDVLIMKGFCEWKYILLPGTLGNSRNHEWFPISKLPPLLAEGYSIS